MNWDLNLKEISFAEESSNSVPSGALIFISDSSIATQIALSPFPPINIQEETKMDERITPSSITLSIERQTGQLIVSFSLTITSCSFTSFTSSTSPSILSATIQPIQSVTLSDTSFVSCHSSASTRSGVHDVSLSEGSTITFTHSYETFTSCSSPKATANLNFLSHPSLSESVISLSLDFDWTKTSDSLADLAVKEGEHPVPGSLFLLFSATKLFPSTPAYSNPTQPPPKHTLVSSTFLKQMSHREQSTSLSWGVECSHTIDANEEDSLVFGETYSISSAHRDGSPVHVTSGITLQIPTEPTVNGASFSFPSLLHKSCILFNAENEIVSKTLLIGYPSTLQFDIHSNLKSITNVEPERDMVLLNGTFWFKMGVKPINLTFHIDENTGNDGQSREEISSPCTTVELTWKITVDLLM
ncbi:hypothetical protein BLNAU_18430 [Blattamonas nauphoetae]|uniref:Uncharacterized protein n=1 Tax=Blattamonas nauphoetae TaxID=2049346 RepID=A0ABQ9X504_9EUKA|nr:hypothetical protein BLNAU_18430 [Blattamonas nauphoetae]